MLRKRYYLRGTVRSKLDRQYHNKRLLPVLLLHLRLPAGYISNYLKPFNGLKSILVLFSDNDEDTDEDKYNGEESGGDDNNESGNQEPESEARELLARADEL